MTTSARGTHFGGFDSVYSLGANTHSLHRSPARQANGDLSPNQSSGWGPKTARPWRDSGFSTVEQVNPGSLTSHRGAECWESGHAAGNQQASRSISAIRSGRTGQANGMTSNHHGVESRDTNEPETQHGNVGRIHAWNRRDPDHPPGNAHLNRPAESSYASSVPLLDQLSDNLEPRGSYSSRLGDRSGDQFYRVSNGDHLGLVQGESNLRSVGTTPPLHQTTPRLRTTPGPIHASEMLPWQTAPGARSSDHQPHSYNGLSDPFGGLPPPNGAHPSSPAELESAFGGLTLSEVGKMSVSCVRSPHDRPSPHMARASPIESSIHSDRGSSRSRQSPNDWYWNRKSIPHFESLDHPVVGAGNANLNTNAYPNTAIGIGEHSRGLRAPDHAFHGVSYQEQEYISRMVPDFDRRPFSSSALTAPDPKLDRTREEQWRQFCSYGVMQRSQSNGTSSLPSHLFPYGLAQGMQNRAQFAPLPHMPEVMPVSRGLPDLPPGHGMRSTLLDEFKTLTSNKGSRHFELRDIYGYVVEFSRDQQGSRFIQHKLDSAGKEERERVFSEIKPEAVLLMKDVFGNYVIQKFFDFGNQMHKTFFLNHMRGKIFELSTHVYACRVIQKALEHNILLEEQASIVSELNSNIQTCVLDSNGNHVIQKIITCVPPEYYRFMVECFLSQITHLSTHKFGCRIVQRLLDHCEPYDKARILEQIHSNAKRLITDQFGNYVPQHVIEYGSLEDREKVISIVRQHLVPFSKQKFASNVVEKCFIYGTDQHRHDIMLQLMRKDHMGETSIPALLRDGFGNYVIQKLLDCLDDADYVHFVLVLEPEINRLRRLIPNKQVENVLGKMRRFDVHTTSAGQSVQTETQSGLSTPMLTPGESGTQSPITASLPSTSNMTIQTFNYDQPRQDPTQKINC